MHACVLMAMFLFIRLNVCGHFWAYVCFTCTDLACLLSWENRLCSIWTEMSDVATVEIAYDLTYFVSVAICRAFTEDRKNP